ncbi:MAG: hypothetical protein ACYSU0_02765 [Planctomycetota bacterium]|jgi:hypothetical protein
MNDLDAIETANLAEIERLNQRGGRTLSFVDLIHAGTVSAELAGELAACVEAGASILTAARQGGVGKSTLLADLLGCLPPGERIVTTPDAHAVQAAHRSAGEGPTCFLAHEIGRGPWYAYLWGEAAAGFFALARTGRRIATCLHADELDELYGQLASLSVGAEDIRSVGIVAFMRKQSKGRRVESVYVPGPGAHRVRWLREEAEDVFLADGPSPAPRERAEALAEVFEGLAGRGVRDFAEVRRALAEKLLRAD